MQSEEVGPGGAAGVAGATVADYVLLAPLRESTSGTYYLARPPARLGLGDGPVALKVLAGRAAGRGSERAVRELRAFAAARSPYLVRVLDAGQQAGTLFYAVEHHPGGSLAAPARPLTRPVVLRAVSDAARAVHALHEAGLAHRDVTPAAVLLTADGGRLADLGLAHALQPGLTVTGLGGVAAVEHVDPDLLLGGRASRQTDVYSLGTTLHRALTGWGLWGALPPDQPLLAVRTVLSKPPRLAPGLTEAEADLVSDCTSRDLARRPATALAVAERLDTLAAAARAAEADAAAAAGAPAPVTPG